MKIDVESYKDLYEREGKKNLGLLLKNETMKHDSNAEHELMKEEAKKLFDENRLLKSMHEHHGFWE